MIISSYDFHYVYNLFTSYLSEFLFYVLYFNDISSLSWSLNFISYQKVSLLSPAMKISFLVDIEGNMLP